MTTAQTETLAFLLMPGFSNLCLANAIEPLRAANQIAGKPLYRRRLATLDGAPVASSSGITVAPDCALAQLGRCDVLFVVSSFDYQALADRAAANALRRAARQADALGGLDTGAWFLARAGYLEDRRATIHWQELEIFAEAFPEVEVSADRFVQDRGRITSGGATTALDLMLKRIRETHGAALAFDLMGFFIYDAERTADGPQRGARSASFAARAPEILSAIDAMEETLETPPPVAEIAARAGCSRRGLERSFLRHLGMSPGRYQQLMRLKRARQLAAETPLPVTEIAVRTGFTSSSTLARAFRAEYGGSIRDLRRGRLAAADGR